MIKSAVASASRAAAESPETIVLPWLRYCARACRQVRIDAGDRGADIGQKPSADGSGQAIAELNGPNSASNAIPNPLHPAGGRGVLI